MRRTGDRKRTGRWQIVLVAAAAVFVMAGCGKDKNAQNGAPEVQTQAPDTRPTEPAEPTPVPTPEKTKKFKRDDFSLQVPVSWAEQYETEDIVGDGENAPSYTVFYAKQCHQETGEGWLFSIGRFKDESYKELPARTVVGRDQGITYVAVYPNRTQTAGASEEAKKQYNKLFGKIEKVTASLLPAKKKEK